MNTVRHIQNNTTTPSTRRLMVLLLFILPVWAYSQDETIPDGTQGEQLEVLRADTVPAQWRDKRWRLFPGKISTLKLGGGFLYEYAGYHQNTAGKQQMDSLGTPLRSMFKMRDFRITASGQFKTRRTISWKAGFMYDGVSKSWFVRETGVMIAFPEIHSQFFIGRTKEGFSLNKVMVGYGGWTLERQMAIDAVPLLADGIKWMAFLPKKKIFWNLGYFNDVVSKGESFSTYAWQVVLRSGWLPVYKPDHKEVLHIGFNYRYGNPLDNKIQLRSRPETNPAPYFIGTGNFSSSHGSTIGYEIYYSKGPWMIGSEYYWHQFNSTDKKNPVFHGGDWVISYILTGESRPYKTTTSIYSFVPVNESVFKGGPGAFEVLLRLSTMDLTDDTIKGGKFWRLTPMINWYLSKDVRFEVAYGYGVLDRFQLKGITHFFQSRIQLTLL